MKFIDIPEPLDDEASRFSTAGGVRLRSDWFIRLRWLAIVVAVVLALIAERVFPGLEFSVLLVPIGILGVVNVAYFILSRKYPARSLGFELNFVRVQMLVDLVLLTMLIHYSGGVENPLFFIYFIHVIIASLMFRGKQVYHIAFLAIFLFTTEVMFSGDVIYGGPALFEHHHIISGGEHLHNHAYIMMMLSSFWFVILFTAFVASSMMSRYRMVRDKLVINQKKLINTEKEKIEFFRYVTHEIKSPVSTVLSAVNATLEIYGDKLDDKAVTLLERAKDRGQQAIDMVKDLSVLTQGANRESLKSSETDVTEMIRKIVDGELADNPRNLRLELSLPDKPVMINTYPDLLEKVILNLVSNAIRYNVENGRLGVTLTDKGNEIVLEISDEGIGIHPEDLEKIFEEFYRTPEAKQLAKIGTGLGLAIVKRFIEKLKGEISVESVQEKGTTFIVRIPGNV